MPFRALALGFALFLPTLAIPLGPAAPPPVKLREVVVATHTPGSTSCGASHP